MKVEFTADGTLRIVPESAVEQFALSKWDRSKIQIEEQDKFFSMLDSSKELLKVINEHRTEYDAFVRQQKDRPADSASAGREQA